MTDSQFALLQRLNESDILYNDLTTDEKIAFDFFLFGLPDFVVKVPFPDESGGLRDICRLAPLGQMALVDEERARLQAQSIELLLQHSRSGELRHIAEYEEQKKSSKRIAIITVTISALTLIATVLFGILALMN